MSETPRPQRPVFPEPPAAPSPAAAQPALTAPPAKQRRWRDDLHLAHTIANKVDSLTLARFDAGNFTVETKSDLTPVTEADKEAERVIREQLGRARGRDSVLPVWATLIGLIEDGQCVVGLVSAPALGRRWWAVSGGGAWTGRSLSSARRLSVSGVDDLSRASMSYSSLSGWAQTKRLRGMLGLMQSCWRTRAYGDFWSYMLVAEGAVDLAAEPELELYDMAALVPVVTEAGGRFTSLDGEPGPFGGNAVATNSLLHDVALHHLSAETD